MGKVAKKEFYSTGDLVETFHINLDTAQRMCRQKRIKARRVGYFWRIPAAEWRRLLREGVPMRVVVEDPEAEGELTE